MVRDVLPVLAVLPPPPPPPLSLLSLPPQAATPNARAVTRQPEAASERTRKFSLLKESDTEWARESSEVRRLRATHNVRERSQPSRLPGRYGASMRAVTASRATRTVIMNESNGLTPRAQSTSQTIRPKVVATTSPMGAELT